MENKSKKQLSDLEKLNKRINELEIRLLKLERNGVNTEAVGYIKEPQAREPGSGSEQLRSTAQGESYESRIGEYGMAWMGNIVLLFGILFLTQLMHKNGQELISVLFGFAAVAGVYVIGHFSRKSFPYMSLLFNYNAHVLLFITSLKIYLIPGSRVIENAFLGYGLVLLVIIALAWLTYRQRSQVLAILVLVMAVVAAITSNTTHMMLPILAGLAGASLFITYRYGWWNVLIISIVAVYCTFLIWMLGNPVMNRSMEIISEHQSGYIYLFVCALIYSALALMPASEKVKPHLLNSTIVVNGLAFSFIMILVVLAFFTESYPVYFGMIAAFCVAYSIWLQARGTLKTIAPLYAIYSFVALSITIGGIYKFPLAFFLLSIQSLLVVSMALWFRSRFIVIMNTLLFIGLLIAYLAFGDPLYSINFSFAIVALITARILNWKKKRLEIRTELIRNIYLFTGASMVLYSLHHSVPTQFITLSWALAGVLFFVLSVLIHNMKYRWLSIITMVITVFYLFIVDLKNISLGYRIVALMFIAVISLGISIYYTRRMKLQKEDREQS